MKNSSSVISNFLKVTPVSKHVCILLSLFLIISLSVPGVVSEPGPFTKDDVISMINGLPSNYEGIPLLRPAISEITSTTNSASVIIDETTDYKGMHPLKVTSSLIGGGSDATNVKKDFNQPQNFSSLTNIELLLNFYEPNPIDKLADIRVDLRMDEYNYYYSYIATQYWRISPGVARIRVGISDFIKRGNPNLNNIRSINLRFSGTNNNFASLGIYSISYNARSVPKVVLTFDDGWQDNYDHAFPILQANGIKATTYIVSEFVQGTDPNYMKGSALDQLYATGWDIGNHSSNHLMYGTQVTNPVVMAGYFNDCLNYLLSRGYNRSAKFLCYPDGKWSDSLIEEIKKIGILSARTTMEGFNTQPYTDIYKLRQITVGRATTFGIDNTVNDIKASIDRAVVNGQTLMVMMHRVTPDSEVDLPVGDPTNSLKTSTTKLTQIAEYLKSLGVETRTMSQWYSEISTTRTLNLNNRMEVEAARLSYNELTSDQKALVTNYPKLIEVEAKMNQLITDSIGVTNGDINNDANIDILDIALIKQHMLKMDLLGSVAQLAADFNDDGKITISDLLAIKMSIMGV